MFGYLRPVKSENHENYLFKSHYCALCKSIGEKYGTFSRMLLSYDAAFLDMFLSALSRKMISTNYENCIVHPFRKRLIKVPGEVEYRFADLTLNLMNLKLLDDAEDEKGLYLFKNLIFKNIYKKSIIKSEKYGFDNLINDYFKTNLNLEKENCSDIDEISNKFGSFLSKVFAFISDDLSIPVDKRHIEFVFLVGKWVYIMDALDDLKEDYKKGKYNSLKYLYIEEILEINDINKSVKYILDKEKWRINLLINHIQTSYLYLRKSIGFFSVEFDDIIFGSIKRMSNSILGSGQS